MVPTEFKVVSSIPPAAILDNTNAAAVAIDCLGYDHATVLVHTGATDIAMAALYMQESDDNSSYVNVTGTTYGTSTGIDGSASTLPSSTADNTVVGFDVDLRARKRYLKLVATAGDGSAGTYLSSIALLSRGEIAPTSATERGMGQCLRV